MALSRRNGTRFQSSIWPGFVDAMTGLLLVLMFVLTIFMVVQFVLTERITGQESELDALSGEVAALAQALGLEERQSAQLEARLGALTASLNSAQARIADQESRIADQAGRIAVLTGERDETAAALAGAEAQITDFEAQVAGLLTEREEARAEISAQEEAARLATARREALDALVADLRARNEETRGALTEAETALAENAQALDAEEAARLAEAAAAEALRARLENADAELTAMTLSLEKQRQEAEDTLTLLAAARAAENDLDTRLTDALIALQAAETAAETAAARAAEEGDAQAQVQEQLAQAVAENMRLQSELDLLRGDLTAGTEDREALRAQLEEAIAAKLAAQTIALDTTTEAQRRNALLNQAQSALAAEEKVSAEAQRQTELLNQQVAALRGQLGELQALLDDARARDAANEIELQSLGSDLNTALARVAVEQQRRAELEAAERARLEAEAAALKDEAQDLAQYRSEFFGRLRDLLGTQEGVRIEGDRFVFSSEVLFAPGDVDLSGEGQAEIAKVAGILRSVADDIPPEIDWVLRVDGHTDDVPLSGQGKYADNWELSQGRALSVVKYMISALDIAPGRLAANGFGQFQPIDPADSDAARARNRRIELKFTEK